MSGEQPSPVTSASAAALRAGLAMSELSLDELWTAYMGLGGTLSKRELTEALQGTRGLSAHEHDMVAQALNDDSVARGHDHPVAYSDDLDAGRE